MRVRLLVLAILMVPLASRADLYSTTAARHGIDPLLFRAIAQVESNSHPWTINLDGEPLRFKKKDDLVAYYRFVQAKPVMLRVLRGGTYQYRWYANALEAEVDYLDAKREDARLGLSRDRTAILRVINPENVDIGSMQINWIHNGRRLGVRFEALVDPKTNTEHAARILAGLIRDHGLWGGVGRYHSWTPWRQQAYTARVYRAYRGILGSVRQTKATSDPSG